MGRSEEFKVVVIDDKASILSAMRAKLAGRRVVDNQGLECSVSVTTVKVEVENCDGRWVLSSSVVDDLVKAASTSPDLVVIDYFYLNREVVPDLKARVQNQTLTRDYLLSRVLEPIDLRRIVRSLPGRQAIRGRVLAQFFGASCPVYLHSFTPDGLSLVAGPIEDRKRHLSRVFPHAEFIKAVDTRREIFNDSAFSSFYDESYYPYQLATFFGQVVDLEILRKQLNASRFLRVKRSAASVAAVASIGGGIGLAGSFIGSYIGDLIRAANYFAAIMVGAFSIIVLILLGTLCPMFFERLMKRLLPEDRSQGSVT